MGDEEAETILQSVELNSPLRRMTIMFDDNTTLNIDDQWSGLSAVQAARSPSNASFVKPGEQAVGRHASGFPIYPQTSERSVGSGAEDAGDVDTDADIPPAQPASAPKLTLQMPTGMKYSDDGHFDNSVPVDVVERVGSVRSTRPSVQSTTLEEQTISVEPVVIMRQKTTATSSRTSRLSDTFGFQDIPTEDPFPEQEEEPLPAKQAPPPKTGPKPPKASLPSLSDEPVEVKAPVKEQPRLVTRGAVTQDSDQGQPCTKCETCPGYEVHFWRKQCRWCRCARVAHRVPPDPKISSNMVLLLAPNFGPHISKERQNLSTAQKKFSWIPVGLTLDQIEAYFRQLPPGNVPQVGTVGEMWRAEQTRIQLPRHDYDLKVCAAFTAEELKEFKNFDDSRLRHHLDIGDIIYCPDFSKAGECGECFLKDDGSHWAYCSRSAETFKPIPLTPASDLTKPRSIKTMRDKPAVAPVLKPRNPNDPPAVPRDGVKTNKASGSRCLTCSVMLMVGEMVVAVERFKSGPEYFHPRCFMCSQCGELLVDLRCFVDVGKEERGRADAAERLFCGRHWADNRKPRCTSCDETIHEKEFIFEGGKAWHMRHFCCELCDTALTGSNSFVPIDGLPHCFECYATNFADKCEECSCAINPSPGFGGKISHNGRHWHKACFCCKTCHQPLNGKPCVPRPDGLYCKVCFKALKSVKEAL
eukprot:m.425937 g.425937  ORF g.425937 m.425937 type:complete len:698 (-) comp56683_c1_seq50:1481-3574(-)